MSTASPFVRRVIIVQAADRGALKNPKMLAKAEEITGMLIQPVSPTGNLPATAYISSGFVTEEFAALLSSPAALAAAMEVPLNTATAVLARCTIREDVDPFTVLDEFGLKLIRGNI